MASVVRQGAGPTQRPKELLLVILVVVVASASKLLSLQAAHSFPRRVTRYPISIWEMTLSILSSPISIF